MVFSTSSFYPQDVLFEKEIPILFTSYARLIQTKGPYVWIIGLTGAMGAGKSRVSSCFRQMGIPVHCADTYVHFLFEHDTDVQQQIKTLWPDVFVEGKIDRQRLGDRVLSSPLDLQKLEELLYPKIAENQKQFLQKNQYAKEQVVVLDVPLLFEVGLDAYCDYVILISASFIIRKQRVMQRKGMTLQKFYTFERLQMKESERQKRADIILYTGRGKGNALKTVKQILFVLSQRPSPKWQGKWPKVLKRRPYESGNCLRHRNNRI